MLSSERLQSLFDVLKDVHTLHEPAQLWRHVLERSCRSLSANGGSFFVVEDDGRMMLAAAVGVDEEQLRGVPIRVGSGLCGWVAEHQESVRVDDVQADTRFNPIADSVTGVITRSLLAIPIFFQSKTHGVLEVVNSAAGSFSPEDQEFMAVVGQQTAIAFQNLLLVRETSQMKTLLESLLLNMSGGLIAMDAGGHVIILNPAAKNLLALSGDRILGKPAAAVLMEFPHLLKLLHETLSSGKTVSRLEMPVMIGSESWRLGYSTILIVDPQQQVLGSGIIFQRLN